MGSSMVQGMLWGAAASDYAELQEPFSIPLWTSMLDAAQVKAGVTVFDAGCGAGGLSVIAAQRGAVVSGIDASDTLIAIAKRAVPKGDFRIGDLEELPYAGQAYKVVIASNVIQYCTNPVAALRELRRVCTPTGRVLIASWGRIEDCDFHGVYQAMGAELPGGPPKDGPFLLSEPEALENILNEAGLVVVSTKGVECPFTYPDEDTFWRAQRSTGHVQRGMQMVEEERLRDAAIGAISRFTKKDGTIRLENRFRFAVTQLNP